MKIIKGQRLYRAYWYRHEDGSSGVTVSSAVVRDVDAMMVFWKGRDTTFSDLAEVLDTYRLTRREALKNLRDRMEAEVAELKGGLTLVQIALDKGSSTR